jgi:N-acyl-L-homoserine lactone synthetase
MYIMGLLKHRKPRGKFRLVPLPQPHLLYSPVAQLVEQVAVNHPVAGSSPARGARKLQGIRFFGLILFF